MVSSDPASVSRWMVTTRSLPTGMRVTGRAGLGWVVLVMDAAFHDRETRPITWPTTLTNGTANEPDRTPLSRLTPRRGRACPMGRRPSRLCRSRPLDQ